MKVSLINTYDSTGGAAVACRRLLYALNKTDEASARLTVLKGKLNDPNIQNLSKNPITSLIGNLSLLRERMYFKPHHNGVINAFYFSPANAGINIKNNIWIREADIIHLHWINLGFLSIKNLKQLASLGKPIVWTLHDMWAFTGGCHYSGDCVNYLQGCGDCNNFMKSPSPNDLSSKLNLQKSFFQDFHFVTCSKWLRQEALKSSLLKNANVVSIPNPIDTNTFKPKGKREARRNLSLKEDVQYILFGAANLNDERKGIKYLLETLEVFASKEINRKTELLLFGKMPDEQLQFSLKVNSLGSISSMDKMVDVYNAADVFVIPSLQDNLPNTIMESLACGTPVAGFDTGGIPQMVDHLQNGFIAEYKNATHLAEGLEYLLNRDGLGESARQKVLSNYTESIVARQYIDFYKSVI